LQIQNASLTPGEEVTLVDPKIAQTVLHGTVLRTVATPCGKFSEANSSFYDLRLAKGLPLSIAIAVIAPVTSFKRTEDVVSADLKHDGHQDFFRYCASSEGLHFTVWSGPSLDSVLQWHQYYYLGYDVEPNCTDREVRD
jgi:hypothetical protein